MWRGAVVSARALPVFLVSSLVVLGSGCSEPDKKTPSQTTGADMSTADMARDMARDMTTDMPADMSVDMGPSRCPDHPPCARGYTFSEHCVCEAPIDRRCETEQDCREGEECKEINLSDTATRKICWFDPAKLGTRTCPGPDCAEDASAADLLAGAASRVITPQGFETPTAKGVKDDATLNFNISSITPEYWNDCGYDGLCPGDEGYTAPDEGEGDGKQQGMWIAGFNIGRPARFCPAEKVGCKDASDCCDSKYAHKDLKVQVAVMRQKGVTVAFAVIDTIGFFHTDIERIRQRISKDAKIDLLVMGATHNHEAPDPLGQWGPLGQSGKDPRFMETIRVKTVEAIEEAVANLKPATLHAAVIDRDIKGLAMADSRPPYIVDDNVPVVVLREKGTEKPIATMLSVGNHAEALWSTNPYLSADFFGFARDYIREGLAAIPAGGEAPERPALEGMGGVTVMYAGAVGGLINPGPGGGIGYDERRVDDRGAELADAIGQRVAKNVLEAWKGGEFREIKPERVEFATTRYFVPIENPVFQLAAFILKAIRRDIYNSTPVSARNYKPNDPQVMVETSIVRLGDLVFFTAPGEVFPELLVGGYPGTYTVQNPTVGDIEEFKTAAACDELGIPTMGGTHPCLYKPNQENVPDWSKAPQGPYMYELIAPTDQTIPFFMGLTQDFLGYMVPLYDYKVDRKGDDTSGSHYEETNGAAEALVPTWQEAMKKNRAALGIGPQ